MIVVPITNQPNQSFRITIPLNDRNIFLGFYVFWNEQAGYWEANITDSAANVPLLSGLPLIGGNAPANNVLKQYEYMNIGRAFIVRLSSATSEWPLVGDWGTNFILVWGS